MSMTANRSKARNVKTRRARPPSKNPARTFASHPYAVAATSLIALLAAAAVANRALANKALRANPPTGKFCKLDNVQLHYVERGEGEPLVLLHGNGSMIQDFVSSGLIDLAAKKYRVIIFDRPGFGYTTRPRSTTFTPEVQADLIHRALQEIGVSRATILGHSWGASVAVALALKYPGSVNGLVLASGYYYPTARADVALFAGPAVPILGDVARYTVAPFLGRLLWPSIVQKLFGPADVPQTFEQFPAEMALRPSQIRASAAESALMVPDAFAASGHYAELAMPVAIIAGEQDRFISFEDQSARLHRELPQSTLHRVPGAGHMVHHTAPEEVMSAIDDVAGAARLGRHREVASLAA
jgi:pimeloyl-ACP methyl ester carboxylesterase